MTDSQDASSSKSEFIPIEIYDRARAYIEHEDMLVNHRKTWILTINGFLLAAVGIMIPRIVGQSAEIAASAAGLGPFDLLGDLESPPGAELDALQIYYQFIFVLCFVGFLVSLIGFFSIRAASDAANAIKHLINEHYPTYSIEHKATKIYYYHVRIDENFRGRLPMVTGGGRDYNDLRGFFISIWLPLIFAAIWFLFAGFIIRANWSSLSPMLPLLLAIIILVILAARIVWVSLSGHSR